jgi:hypothetical protein
VPRSDDGDPWGGDKAQISPLISGYRFPALQLGDVNVIIKATGWIMGSDTELGPQFSLPYFFGGALTWRTVISEFPTLHVLRAEQYVSKQAPQSNASSPTICRPMVSP